MSDYVTIRVWTDTRRLLRLIAAQTDEQMVEVMHRLCEAEWQRVQVVRSLGRSDTPRPAENGGEAPETAGK